MRFNLLEEAVIVMYDIRDIQKFIFNSNRLKDIIGASILVEDLLAKGIRECGEKHPEIHYEIVFIGGGNASVLFDTGREASIINRELSVWVQQNTYSLQLAIAVIARSDRYDTDYANLQKEMTRVKAQMVRTGLLGALPIVERETFTGLATTDEINDVDGIKRVSRETYLKRTKLNSQTLENTKFDDMVEAKGKDSTLAVVHIDGNNMGKRIKHLMEGIESYDDAKNRMKMISQNINKSFADAFQVMRNKLEQWLCDSSENYLRKIILAGDDITFVCTAKYAISLVELFVVALKDSVLFDEFEDVERNLAANGFTVCAGIAFMHSHFPFSEAYKIAEQCCENAKKTAKQERQKHCGIIGNWVDFQICKDLQAVNLEKCRESNYRLSNGEYLLKRPYYMPFVNQNVKAFTDMNIKNKSYSIAVLKEQLQYILGQKGDSKLMKSDLKEIRNTYTLGSDAVEELLVFLESRNKTLPSDAFDEEKKANWYDALELYEIYELVE